jgi:hypothetical protein
MKSFMFILSYEAGFYKLTILKVHPPISGITAHTTMPGRSQHSTYLLLQAFDPNEWCLKNGLLSGCLNPRPISHESSALTTRPQLLAKFCYNFYLFRDAPMGDNFDLGGKC